MQQDLREYLKRLEPAGMLIIIEQEVDPKFEITALMDAAEKKGKAILFGNVKNSDLSVAANLFATREMLALLFDTTPKHVVNEWIDRTKNSIEPILIDSGPNKEVIKAGERVDLGKLPIVTHCEKDAGPYITGGLVIAKDPETGLRNVSINRMQFKGKNKLGIRMMPSQHLGMIFEKCEKMGKDLEIAVAIGNHPFEALSAVTTLNFGMDELNVASALRGEPLQMVRCESVNLEVPATAEIIVEGKVLADVREEEGPFGDTMQNYIPVMENNVFQVTAITHRKDAILHTIQASSQDEIHLIALAREASVYEAVSKAADVQAISLAPFYFGCSISIKKRFEGEPKNVAAAAFGAFNWLKYCVVVDHDVNVFDINDVWWAMSIRSKPDTGLFIIKNALGWSRDPYHFHQSKVGIDATAPLDKWDEFERKKVPGADKINLENYQ